MSTRLGGVSAQPLGMNLSFSVNDDESNVKRNRELFFGSLNIKLEELAIPRQVHSSTVKRADQAGSYQECDALTTDRQRVFLCVSVADCVPVFIVDRTKKVVAGIHAGWRGTVGKIVEHTLEAMQNEHGCHPSDLCAFVGPCAGECCYNVGDDVASQFDEQFVRRSDGKVLVNLKSANEAQLTSCGVPPVAIEVSRLCTITESHLLHSYRRDKEKSGRMMGVIGLR